LYSLTTWINLDKDNRKNDKFEKKVHKMENNSINHHHIHNHNHKMIDFNNKIILAPMVRVCTYPFRQLCLKYGVDLVFSEKVMDWRLKNAERRINNILDTVDFIDKTDGSIIFRTSASERNKVILQIGTADPEQALLAAKIVEQDVGGIDVNMSCPKDFSLKTGMGVALLSDPDRAKAILLKLVQNLTIPVTCKIRMLQNEQESLDLVRELESCGITALSMHGRTKTERPQGSVNTQIINQVCQISRIPIISNGGSKEIEKYTDILNFKELCGSDAVMVARAAQWNCSIFRKEGKLPIHDVIKDYLKLCVDYENSLHNTKYCIQNMLRVGLQDGTSLEWEINVESAITMYQLCDLWQLGEYCKEKQLELQKKRCL
jgi:tRNA-dihydrouridine synthase 2